MLATNRLRSHKLRTLILSHSRILKGAATELFWSYISIGATSEHSQLFPEKLDASPLTDVNEAVFPLEIFPLMRPQSHSYDRAGGSRISLRSHSPHPAPQNPLFLILFHLSFPLILLSPLVIFYALEFPLQPFLLLLASSFPHTSPSFSLTPTHKVVNFITSYNGVRFIFFGITNFFLFKSMLDISVFSVHPFPVLALSVMAVQLFQVVLVSSTGCCPPAHPCTAAAAALLYTVQCTATGRGAGAGTSLATGPARFLLTYHPLSLSLNPLLRLHLD